MSKANPAWLAVNVVFAGVALALGGCGGADGQQAGDDEEIGVYEGAISTSITTDSSISSPCPSGTWDMLDWMTSNTRTTNHLVATGDYKANYIGPSRLYQIKNSAGHPWDVLNIDTTASGYLYQWATENADQSGWWSDASAYKVHNQNSGKGTIFMPRCVTIPKDSSGNIKWGGKLWGLYHDMSYDSYQPTCTKYATTGGNAINELWGPFQGRVTVNGSAQDVLENHYRRNCTTTSQSGAMFDGTYYCKYMEVFTYSQTWGWVEWQQYVPNSTGTGWVLSQGGVVDGTVSSGGAPSPVHPCW